MWRDNQKHSPIKKLTINRYFLQIEINYFLSNTKKTNNMSNLLYTIAVILIIFWAIGFFAYSAGGIIHILLVIAVISILLRIIRGGKIIK